MERMFYNMIKLTRKLNKTVKTTSFIHALAFIRFLISYQNYQCCSQSYIKEDCRRMITAFFGGEFLICFSV